MTLKKRQIIFYGLILIFIPSSIVVIFYSQGWRININIENCKIEKLKDCLPDFQKTGAIYIETMPKDVLIKLNNKIIPDKSGILKTGTLITDLAPKTYKAEIQKNGYLAYYKNLKVEQSKVTEMINTILIPKKIEKTTLIEKIKGEEIIDLITKRTIVKNQQNNIFYLYKLNDSFAALNINASFNNTMGKTTIIKEIKLHPFNEDRLIIKTIDGLYIFDIRKLQIETIFKNDKKNAISTWTSDNSNLYTIRCQILNIKCQIYSYNLITKIESEIPNLSENALNIAKIKTSDYGIAFLKKSGELSMFNNKEKSIKKISDDVKEFSFSPDAKKILFLKNNGEIIIYFIEEWYKNSPKKAREIINFILENKELIKNAYWYKDSYHLFVKYDNKINFMEIDDRSPLNQFTIISSPESVFYDANQNLLFFTQNKTLYNIKI